MKETILQFFHNLRIMAYSFRWKNESICAKDEYDHAKYICKNCIKNFFSWFKIKKKYHFDDDELPF